MKLTEALNIIHGATHRKGGTFKSFLATGLNPLHLKTFIAAELSLLFTDRKIEIQTGLYGDFLGNLRRLSKAEVDAGIVVMEWADLDPRLGIRTTAGWTPSICTEILSTAQNRAADIQEAITEAAAGQPLSLCLPTLPLPPVSHTPGWQAGALPGLASFREIPGPTPQSAADRCGLSLARPVRRSV